jgi:hypothetical protein
MKKAAFVISSILFGFLVSTLLALVSIYLLLLFPIISYYIYQVLTTKIRVKNVGKNALENVLNELVNNNIELIARAYRSTVSSNSFGKKDYTRFKKELLEYLFDNAQSKEALRYEEEFGDFEIPDDAILLIEEAIEEYSNAGDYSDDMDPYVYEHFCAEQFKLAGWDHAEATSGSADQGVDVIAKRGNEFLVGQCKKYSKPVGNSAVQQVVAGIKYYGANKGVVISPSGFTASAEKLAVSNNIELIHHSEIKNL